MKLFVVVKISFHLDTVVVKVDMSAINSLLTSQDFSIFTDIVPVAFDLNITIDTKVDTITVLIVKVAIVVNIITFISMSVGVVGDDILVSS